MRNFIAPYVVLGLSTMLVFLIIVPQESASISPVMVLKGAMNVLTPFVQRFRSNLNAISEAEKVKIRVWMHKGDRQRNGCGFYFRVDGSAGGSASSLFPSKQIHKCKKGDQYEMRMTSQGAMYDKTVRLGNEQAESVEVHADGWTNTYVNVMCVGFNERTIAGGPRAFCVNNDLLKGCKKLMNKWSNINIDFKNLMLTRSSRGTHKIKFREIDHMVNAFERLERNIDDVDAMWTACDRIDLVKGTGSSRDWTCTANRYWVEATGAFDYAGAWSQQSHPQNTDPYGCDRYTARGY